MRNAIVASALLLALATPAEAADITYVYADWCAPCHLIGPVIEWWAKERGHTFHKVKIEDTQETGVPILIALSFDGNTQYRYGYGARSVNDFHPEKLDRWLKDLGLWSD